MENQGPYLRLTPQRMAILDYLRGNSAHPSAREIYEAVHERFPSLSFATVYNTLQALRNRGIVRELSVDRREKRYDPAHGEHHHFLCTQCGGIRDVCSELRLKIPEEELGGARVSSCEVHFFGLCRPCQEQKEGGVKVMAVFKCDKCGDTREGRCKPKKCKKCEGENTFVKQV